MAPDPGEPYNGCGVLIQGLDCVLFASPGDGTTYVLEHIGPFQVGDSVCVRGFLDANCETACSGANGCIHNNSIAPWQPAPHPYFHGCGVVLQGTNCMLFQLFTEQYPNTFSVEISESLSVGDTVCLHGWIDPNCQPPCPEAHACLSSYIIDPPNPGNPFQGCGVLIQGTGCVLLQAFSDTAGAFVLENYGPFGVGDSVCVRGVLDFGCDSICPEAVACILDNDIQPWEPDTVITYQGCGVLVQEPECLLFVPMGQGNMRLVLQYYGGFGAGDSVCVQGILLPNSPGVCSAATGFLANNSITGNNSPDPQFNACGWLIQSGGCLLFVPMGIDSFRLALQHYGGFGPGDSVCVRGVLMGNPPGTCPTATGFLANNTITGGNPQNPSYSACGVIVQMGTCAVFVADYPDTITFVLQNYGAFGPGDSVCVQGTVVVAPPIGCPWVFGRLINNAIESAGANASPISSNGTLSARNYPNPFNPVTNIQFDLPQTGHVMISVYNSLGQAVKILADRIMSAGNQQVNWDGTDLTGRSVASGIYFYRIEFNGISETRKMLLMK